MSEKKDFPRFVFKKGTAKKQDESGLYQAEGVHVSSHEELAKLDGEWCNSPAEAGEGATVGASPTTGASARNGVQTDTTGHVDNKHGAMPIQPEKHQADERHAKHHRTK